MDKKIYDHLNRSLKKKYGKATHCEEKSCNNIHPKKFEWVLKRGRVYSDNLDDFIQLCSSCSRKYCITDTTRKKMSEKRKGEKHPLSKLTEADILAIYDLIKVYKMQIKTIAKYYNIASCTVSNIKNGRSWPHLFKQYSLSDISKKEA